MLRNVSTKFMLPIGIVTFLFGIFVAYRTYATSKQSIIELTQDQARLGMAYSMAIRDYVAKQVRPHLKDAFGTDEFVPELMSTSFVSREISDQVAKRSPGYIIRFSAKNPRNPANQATAEEIRILERFNQDLSLREWTGEISIDGKRYLAHYQPKRMESACLKCHGDPADAPRGLVNRYGEQAGFHLPVGQTVGLDTVAVPIEAVESALWGNLTQHFLIILAGVILVAVTVPLSFRFALAGRLSAMASHFEAMANRPDSSHVEQVNIGGNDEIGTLARSFNVLAKRLNLAYESMDARVQERTAQLALANNALEIENTERKRAENKLREYADLLKYKNVELEAQKEELLAQQEELKWINRELKVATDAATAANSAKSEFLANMSHEIRTPMTAVSGYTDLMLDMIYSCPTCSNGAACSIKHTGHEYLSSIRRNGDHLLQLIDDILDLSKVESGKLSIERTPCSPLEIMEEVQSLMKVRADSRGLSLTAMTVGPMPEKILSDARRIKQVLINLVGNAVKFTSSGSVIIKAQVVDDLGLQKLAFSISDTGVGIRSDQMGRLFKPFSQLDTSASRQFGGSGLGLAISQRLAELLGGSITVQSESDKGSTFTFTVDTGPLSEQKMIASDGPIPACSAPVPAASASTKSQLLKCRILLAEDGPDNQKLISFLLQQAGAQVQICDNGQLAVEAVQAAEQRGEPFDVVLMDMQMPVMDGYRATRTLREQGYTRPILALTAHAMVSDRKKCLDAGCDEFATKPIDRRRLIQLIDNHVAHADSAAC